MLLIPATEKDALVNWVKSTTLDDDVVFDNSTNTLLSIKSLTIHQISCAALQLFCVHHQVSGYKKKSKEVTCLCIIQAVRLKAVCETMYFHHKDGSEADDNDDCTSDNAGDMVLAGKEEDGNYEDIVSVGENEIISVQQRKKRKSKSSTPDSLSKSGIYYRVLNTYMAGVNRPFVVNIGSNLTMTALDSHQFLHKAIHEIFASVIQ
jgi:hypothetical protein